MPGSCASAESVFHCWPLTSAKTSGIARSSSSCKSSTKPWVLIAPPAHWLRLRESPSGSALRPDCPFEPPQPKTTTLPLSSGKAGYLSSLANESPFLVSAQVVHRQVREWRELQVPP